jgi:hypothetical protein
MSVFTLILPFLSTPTQNSVLALKTIKLVGLFIVGGEWLFYRLTAQPIFTSTTLSIEELS